MKEFSLTHDYIKRGVDAVKVIRDYVLAIGESLRIRFLYIFVNGYDVRV